MINLAGITWIITAKQKLEEGKELEGMEDLFMALRLLVLYAENPRGAEVGTRLDSAHYKICEAEDIYVDWKQYQMQEEYLTKTLDGEDNAFPTT